MRKKKRYVLLKELKFTEGVSNDDMQFLFQNSSGYVLKVSPKVAEKLRPSAILISGSIRKLKLYKSAK